MANEIDISVKIDSGRALRNLERIESVLAKLDKTLNIVNKIFNKTISSADKVSKKVNGAATSLKNYGASANKSSSSVKKLASSTDSATSKIGKLNTEARKSVGILSKFNAQLKTSAKGVGRGFLAGAIHNIINFALGISNAGSSFLGFRNALTVATGSVEEANTRMKFAIGLANHLKLNIVSVTKEYSRFVNSATLAGLAIDKANRYFKSFATAARVLNLNGMETSGMFLALEQMISKGFLSMEELRRQLGQYLPASMAIAAEAAGYTKDKIKDFYKAVAKGNMETLPFMAKFAKLIEERTGHLLPLALKKSSAAFQGFYNSIKMIQVTLGIALQTPLVKIAQALEIVTKWIGRALVGTSEFQKVIAVAFDNDTVQNANELGSSIENISTQAEKAKVSITEMAESMKFDKSEVGSSAIGVIGSVGIGALGLAGITKMMSLVKSFFGWVFAPLTSFIGKWGSVSKILLKTGAIIGTLQKAFMFLFASAGGLVTVFTAAAIGGYVYWKSLQRTVKSASKDIDMMEVKTRGAADAFSDYDIALEVIGETLDEVGGNQKLFNDELERSKSLSEQAGIAIAGIQPEMVALEMQIEATKQLITQFSKMENSDATVKSLTASLSSALGRMLDLQKTSGAISLSIKDSITKMRESAALMGDKGDGSGGVIEILKKTELRTQALNAARKMGIDVNSKAVRAIEIFISKGLKPEIGARKIIIKQIVEHEKYQKRLTNTRKKSTKVLKDNTAAIKDQIKNIQVEINGIGLAGKELEIYNLQKEIAAMYSKLLSSIQKDEASSLLELSILYSRGATLIAEFYIKKKKLIDDKAALEKMKKEAEAFNKIWEDFGKGIEDVFVDLFSGTFDSFKSFSDAIKDVFKNLLRDLIRMAIQNQIIIPVSMQQVGGVPGSGGGVSSMIGQNGSAIPGIGNFTGGFSSAFLGSAGSFVSGLGGSFFGGMGAGLGASAGGFGSAWAAFSQGLVSGTTAGFGMALGAAIPYIGWALAVLSAIGAFDDKEAASRFKILPGGKTRNDKGFSTIRKDFGSEVYKGSINDPSNRSIINVNSIFGTMGAGIQHVGKDEQIPDAEAQQYLDAMITLFSQLAKIDKAIADAYDLSDEAIDKIKEATEGMGDITKKWKSPNIGDYIVDRYKIVFSEIGGLSEKLFNDMTTAGMTAEQAIAALTATFQLDSVLESLTTVGDSVEEIWANMNMTQIELLTEQESKIYELADAYDGSVSSANALISALAAQQQATIKLLIDIKKFKEEAGKGFSNLREKILTDLMDDRQKYSYYKEQLDSISALIATTTDFEKLQSLNNQFMDYANKAWALQLKQGPEAAGSAQQDWLDYLDKEQVLLNDQLLKAEEQAKKQAKDIADAVSQTLMDTVVPALTDAAGDVSDAGNTMNNAANTIFNAGGLMIEAASDMKYAASNQNVNVTFDGTGLGDYFSPPAIGAG
jgi:tape measure domain-containing protein